MEASLLGFSPNLVNLFRRGCIECNPNTPLTCPNCPTGQVCIQVSSTCTECAYRKCVPEAQSGATNNMAPKPSRGPNVGAIAGGVIGGVVVIAAIVGIVYWFWIRKRRQRWEATQAQYEQYSEKSSDGYTLSGRSRHSMASTTRTRGSNVIQIAFIPGVTDRSADGFTPPVPPVPSSQPQSPYTDSSGDHYFMPGDLRDSTYSGFTADGASTIDRRSVARSIAPSISPSLAPSIAPSLLRQSFASTIYQEDAIANPMPAQIFQSGRANVVSVKSSAAASSAGSTPQSRSGSVPNVPQIDREKYGAPSNSASAKAGPSVLISGTGFSPTSPQSIPEESEVPSIHVTRDDASERSADAFSVRSGTPNLKNAIEEATRRASRQPTHGGLGSVRTADPSPFSDQNRLSEGSSSDGSAQ